MSAGEGLHESVVASSTKYQLAYERAPIAMAITAVDGRILDGNPRFFEMAGWSREELVGRRITDSYLDPSVRPALIEEFRSTGRIAGAVVRLRRKSGEIVVARLHTEELRLEGVPPLLFTAVEDLSPLVQTQERLAEHVAEYRQLFEQSRDAIVVTAADGAVIDANPAARRLFEIPAGELPASAGELYAEAAARAALLAELDRAGYVTADDVRFRTRTGRVFVGEVTAVARRDSAGRVIGTQGTIRDVTERRRTEHLLRTLVDASPLAIICTDLDARVTLWNPAAERLYGWAEAEILGQPVTPAVPQELLAEYMEQRAETLVGRPPRLVETWRVRKSGERFLASLSFAPLQTTSGPATGVMVVAEDVTERRRTESQLRQSQTFEVVGRLAGGVAHDFNNLLTVVMAETAAILAASAPGSAVHDSAGEIDAAARRGAALTKQLLAVSRQQVLSPTVVDLVSIVRETERMLSRVIGENIEIRLDLADDLWLVRADPSQLHQVVLNLAINARDAMPDGGTLGIAARNRCVTKPRWCVDGAIEPGDYVELRVSDTGTGMDEATVASVFEPFFTTKPGSGVGLGLPTVLGIVTQSHGGIEIRTSPGQGTTFIVYLPRAAADAVLPATAVAAPAVAEPVGGTVLLVEDDPTVRAVTRRVLEQVGYRVLEAGDGPAALALEAATTEPIAVLVTDTVMPHFPGPRLATELLARRPGMGVVLMSGYPDTAALSRSRPAQAEFLEKPFRSDQLLAAVRRALRRATAH